MTAEIADVQQAIDDLKKLCGFTDRDITQAQKEKNEINGTFKQGLFIEYIEIPDNDKWVGYYRKNADRYPEIK